MPATGRRYPEREGTMLIRDAGWAAIAATLYGWGVWQTVCGSLIRPRRAHRPAPSGRDGRDAGGPG
jgi:hypothetical protein